MIRLWMMNSEFSIAGRAGRCRLDPRLSSLRLLAAGTLIRFGCGSAGLLLLSPHTASIPALGE